MAARASGQEGLDLVGGRGVALEEVAPLGHEGGAGRDGFGHRFSEAAGRLGGGMESICIIATG